MSRCDEEILIDDYLDGCLSPEQSTRVELHLAECEDCHRAYERTLAVRKLAAELPRRLEPEHDLWPKIAAQIAAIPAGKRGFGFLTGWRAIAVAASVLVAVGMCALASYWRSHDESLRQVAITTDPSAGTPVLAEVEKAEEAYTDAANSLLADLESTAGSLTPEVRRSLESNLAVTDQAISDIKTALTQHPNDLALARKLFVAHERRVELLQDVAQLSLSNRNGG